MATIQVLGPNPIPSGPATAVQQVTSTMATLTGKMEQYSSEFSQILGAMVDAAAIEDTQFAGVELDFSPQPVNISAGGITVDLNLADDISTDVPAMPDLTVTLPIKPAFTNPEAPAPIVLNMPAAPQAFTGSAPTRPGISTEVEVPDAPDIQFPGMPDLLTVNIPQFIAPVLPTFAEAAPTFNVAQPNTAMVFEEPEYASESLDEVMATLKRIRLGGTGLPAWVEQMLHDRARAREDRNADKAVAEIFDNFGGRGFPAPPGVLTAQVAAVREASQLAVNTLSRDILIKATDVEVEQLRFSVTQGLAAEQLLMNIFSNAVTRAFEQAKFTVQMAIQLHDSLVAVFNTLTSAWQTKATVHKMQLDAEIQKLEARRLELEGEKLKGDINSQRVQLLEAQIRASLARIEVFKGQLQAAETRSNVVKNTLDAYRIDVQAFAETIGAKKLEYDGYKTSVEGQQAIAEIGRNNATIFSALVGADEVKQRMWVQESNVLLEQARLGGTNYGLSLDAFRTLNAGILGRINADADLKRVAIAATGTRNQAVIAGNEAAQRIGQQQLQAQIAKAELGIKLYDVTINKLNQQKELQQRALQAAGQQLATLAGGAMAAMNISASISSSASDGYSISKSESITNTLNEKV